MKLMAEGTMHTLLAGLAAAGKEAHVYTCTDGAKLLVLPHGARVLGLYPANSEVNFYWANQALEEPSEAKALFASEGWHNTGGDRTWISPELDIFFPDYPKCQAHWEPPQLDASEYTISHSGAGLRLAQRMQLELARPCRTVELELSKTLSAAACPLRHEQEYASLLENVAYAGYTQRTTLALLGEAEKNPTALGIWNLIQLPHGGELIVPTYYKTEPLALFGELPADKMSIGDRLLRWSVTYPGEHKIAIRAAAICGRVGYLYPQGEQWSLVVRNFHVNPSGEYVDVPKGDPADLGYAINAVNIESALGDFCEMEYHAPAIAAHEGQFATEENSQVWAFRGDKTAIEAIARVLLGA